MLVSEEMSSSTVEAIESPTIGANPNRAGGVFADRSDRVIRQAMFIFRIVTVKSELSAISVQTIEATVRPNPETSLAVPLHAPNHVPVQAVGIQRAVSIVHKRGWSSREPAHTVFCCYPHHSFAVFK